MNSDGVMKLNRIFDKIDDSLYEENEIDKEIERYNILKRELQISETKIEKMAKQNNLFFNKELGVVTNINTNVIAINIDLRYKNKEDDRNNHVKKIEIINNDDFNSIKKYLVNDKEKASDFLNFTKESNIKQLKDIANCINNMCCGICSTYNIKEISLNKFINEYNTLYNLIFEQIENETITIYGNISFIYLTIDEFNKYKGGN